MRRRFFSRSSKIFFCFSSKKNIFVRSSKDCSEFAIHLIDLVELAYETIGKKSEETKTNEKFLGKLFIFSFINADNNVSNSFINPVNLLVTGEVLVERNENASSLFKNKEFFLSVRIENFSFQFEKRCDKLTFKWMTRVIFTMVSKLCGSARLTRVFVRHRFVELFDFVFAEEKSRQNQWNDENFLWAAELIDSKTRRSIRQISIWIFELVMTKRKNRKISFLEHRRTTLVNTSSSSVVYLFESLSIFSKNKTNVENRRAFRIRSGNKSRSLHVDQQRIGFVEARCRQKIV